VTDPDWPIVGGEDQGDGDDIVCHEVSAKDATTLASSPFEKSKAEEVGSLLYPFFSRGSLPASLLESMVNKLIDLYSLPKTEAISSAIREKIKKRIDNERSTVLKRIPNIPINGNLCIDLKPRTRGVAPEDESIIIAMAIGIYGHDLGTLGFGPERIPKTKGLQHLDWSDPTPTHRRYSLATVIILSTSSD